ncbi:MAG: hypothetical protein ACLQNE_33755 [Thermoguttaceae bacterium]|jgi:hypothetical protein
MSFNFFSWLRDGVKQSVILGVSDAVQHLGTPREGDEIEQRLLAFTQPGGDAAMPRQIAGATGRRKLGRTLEQIQASTSKAT